MPNCHWFICKNLFTVKLISSDALQFMAIEIVTENIRLKKKIVQLLNVQNRMFYNRFSNEMFWLCKICSAEILIDDSLLKNFITTSLISHLLTITQLSKYNYQHFIFNFGFQLNVYFFSAKLWFLFQCLDTFWCITIDFKYWKNLSKFITIASLA